MENVTGSEGIHTTTEGAAVDTSALEAEVRTTIAQGSNVQQEVRDLTVKALSRHDHDRESLRHVMTAVMKGVREGAQQKLQVSAAHMHTPFVPVRDAVAGLDDALAQFAEASKLALEEAAGRARQFSSEELTRLRTDLESVENLFLETVQESASAAQDLVEHTLRDLLVHAKRNGTAVGSQLKDTLETLNNQMLSTGYNQVETGIRLARAITDQMRRIAAGVLADIAERVKPDNKPKGYQG